MAVLLCVGSFALGVLFAVSYRALALRRKDGIQHLIEISTELRNIQWGDGANVVTALDNAVGRMVDIYDRELSYYRGRRNKAGVAKIIRLVAWTIGTMGALCPLIAPLFTESSAGSAAVRIAAFEIPILPLGYAFLAFAGALLAANRFLGLTDGHIRYTTTQLALEGHLNKLSYDWLKLKATIDHPTKEQIAEAFSILETAREALHGGVQAETKTWATQTAEQEAAQAQSYKQAGGA